VSLGSTRVLVVGAGGLGSPASRALAQAGVGHLRIVDDDIVEVSNLQRQVLYGDEDVGADKATTAARVLWTLAREAGHPTSTEAVRTRFLPDTAAELLAGIDLVLEGADNFATKFLVADACALAAIPCVQAGAVRWSGWALACANRRPHGLCMRCVFEDIPRDRVETCATAGVVGPVVGVLGALQARLAVAWARRESIDGRLYSYHGLEGRLRRRRVRPRADCPHARGAIQDLRPERYAASCAAS